MYPSTLNPVFPLLLSSFLLFEILNFSFQVPDCREVIFLEVLPDFEWIIGVSEAGFHVFAASAGGFEGF